MKTPVNHIEKYDHLPPEDAVREAWNNPGTNPQWHRRMQAELDRTMPLLARALDRMKR